MPDPLAGMEALVVIAEDGPVVDCFVADGVVAEVCFAAVADPVAEHVAVPVAAGYLVLYVPAADGIVAADFAVAGLE